MPIKDIVIGENINHKLLWTSLMMIFVASVIASRFDSWYAIVGGAVLAMFGCYLNQRSVKWVTKGDKIIIDESEGERREREQEQNK